MDSFDSAGRILGPMSAGALYPLEPRYPYMVSAAILGVAASLLWLRKVWAAGAARPITPPDGA
jgi:hypothetical protein